MKNYRIIFYVIFPAFIFIVVGICFFGMAIVNYNNMQLEKEKQQELYISGENMDSEALERISRIDGVCNLTQVYTLSAQMQLGDIIKDVSIDGIAADYLDDDMISDEKVSSGLIVNEAAIRMFEQDESKTQSYSTQDNSKDSQSEESTEEKSPVDHEYYEGRQVVLTVNEQNVTATIKKVVDDSKADEEPYIYTNISSIKNLQQKCDVESTCTQIRAKISDANRQEAVYSKLTNYGYTVENVDTQTLSDWKLLQAKIDGWRNVSIIAFWAGIYILVIKYKNINLLLGRKN